MGPFRSLPGALLQDGPEIGAPRLPPGEFKQTVLIDVAEGTAQNSGQAQFVVGIEGEAGEGDQVVEDDVRRQLQPVGPGHRYAGGFQRPDDLLEGRVAATHQDQEVAIAAGPQPAPLAVLDRHAGFDLTLDPGRQFRRQLLAAAGGRLLVDRVPDVGLGRLLVLEQGPQVDAAVIGRAFGDMGGDVAHILAHEGGGPLRSVEDRVDEAEHLRRRSEGGGQLDRQEGCARAGHQTVVALGFLAQPFGPRTLEGIDRLFLVTDREDGAGRKLSGGGEDPRNPPAVAGEEALGQRPYDVPLLGRGVLGLIDQHMLDPAVEFVQHPGG